jgi:GTP pyrophosphokinase
MHAKYAKVNGHLASVKTILHRGDCVEVGTDESVTPKEDWRGSAKSYKALRNIHQYLDRLPKPLYDRCPVCHPIPGEEVIGFTEENGRISVHRMDCSEAIAMSSRYGDSIVAVDFQAEESVLYPASITVHAVDRQHLLSDLIDSISNKFRLSINSLHTVTEDEIVTCTVNFYVHSYDELQTIVDTISDISDVDEVKYQND